MERSHLSNLRLIAIESTNRGQDWFQLSGTLDQFLDLEGFDLAEEAVYLCFLGEGECLVARSVIGPKKELVGPYRLFDKKAGPVLREVLTDSTFSAVFDQVHAHGREKFVVKIGRKLEPALGFSLELIFEE